MYSCLKRSRSQSARSCGDENMTADAFVFCSRVGTFFLFFINTHCLFSVFTDAGQKVPWKDRVPSLSRMRRLTLNFSIRFGRLARRVASASTPLCTVCRNCMKSNGKKLCYSLSRSLLTFLCFHIHLVRWSRGSRCAYCLAVLIPTSLQWPICPWILCIANSACI